MPNRHGKNAGVLLGKYDLSPYLNEASASMSLETAETSTFGSNAKSYILGQNDATISFSGLFDGAAGAIAAIFEDVIDNDLTPAITFAYDGGVVEGRECALANGKQTSYEISAPVADIVSLNGEFQVTGGIRHGILLAGAAAQTSSTVGTVFDNTAATTIGATANLHVTANTRSTASTIKIQHSVDNSTWVDLFTFTTVALGTTTSESLSVSGTINRYLRANTTLTAGTGSITLTLSLARRNN